MKLSFCLIIFWKRRTFFPNGVKNFSFHQILHILTHAEAKNVDHIEVQLSRGWEGAVEGAVRGGVGHLCTAQGWGEQVSCHVAE